MFSYDLYPREIALIITSLVLVIYGWWVTYLYYKLHEENIKLGQHILAAKFDYDNIKAELASKNTENIHNLGVINQLQFTNKKLLWQIENPPKYKKGETFKLKHKADVFYSISDVRLDETLKSNILRVIIELGHIFTGYKDKKWYNLAKEAQKLNCAEYYYSYLVNPNIGLVHPGKEFTEEFITENKI